MFFGVCRLVSKGASMLSLAIVRDVIVLPHCGIKSRSARIAQSVVRLASD